MPNHRNPSTPVALRFSLILLASLLLLALATCGKDSPTKPSPPQPPTPTPVQPVPTRITIAPATVTLMAVGQTQKLTASVLDQNGQPIAGANVSWSSSSTAVVTVTSQGLVTAVMNGAAQITARVGNASASVTVTVAQSAVRITISPPSATLMAIGDTVQLTAAVLDQNGQPVDGAVVTWSSSDEAVATVSTQGLVTAVGNGAAQITARAGNVSTSIDVTVMQAPGSIVIEPAEATLMAIAETVQLTATVLDQNGQPVEGAVVTWSSSDENVATVTGQGLVTAVMNGAAQITARVGNASASVTVTVAQSAVRITISPPSATLMAIGDTVQLTAAVLDQNGQPVDGAVVTWSSSDEAVATVSTQGLVTAVGNGAAQITARAGNVSTSIDVTVMQAPGSIVIEPAEATLMAIAETVQLTATVLDQNGQPVEGAVVTWSSSDENVATVTGQGLVTAVMNGAAQITARVGNASASVTVTVAQSAVRITISPPSATLMAIGDTVQLTAAVLDQNGQPVDGAVVTWSSSDEAVATVSTQGLVTAVGNGAAQITARAGNVSTSIDVTVMQAPGSIVIEPAEATLMAIGETVQLTATVLDQNGQPVEGAVVTWSSSDENVATVTGQGLVTAVMNGAAQITARVGNASASVTVTVAQSAVRITISPPSATLMAIGDTVQLTAAVLDQNGQPVDGAVVTWSSSDEAVATISSQGLVTAVSNGTTRVTARSGTATASVTVTVMDNSRDREALVALYQATNGPNWSNNENWLSDAPLDEWHGISTDYLGRVVGVDLYDNHLSGSIPPEIGLLQNLEILSISDERLLEPIPPEIGELRSLRVLGLVNNDITGPIPPEIGQLKNLEQLNLGRNNLTGLIPPAIGQLMNLKDLFLNANRLTGPIPPEIGQLKNLVRIGLSDGGLTGPIPPEIAELQNLEALSIHNNRLEGPLPPEIGQLRSLRRLGLSFNEITGLIPPVISQLKNLEFLDLGANQMTGPLPPEIGQLENLHTLYLGGLSRGNQLTGPIPPEIGQLKNLEILWLANNSGLLGSLPESMTMLTKLKELELGNTQLCVPATEPFQSWYSGIPQRTKDAGVICSSPARDALIALYDVTNGPGWTNSTNWTSFEPLDQWHGVATDAEGEVTALVLEENNLSGLLPRELGNLTGMKTLDLSFNMGLTGVISASYIQLDLVELDLEGTQVCAPPDAEFQQWLENIPQLSVALCTDTRRDYYALAALYSATNGPGWTNSTNWLSGEPLGKWHGVQTDTEGQVTILGLAANGLRGPLPPEIGELRNLTELELSNNEITGPFPPEIGELRSLRKLRLANSELTGPLPPEIEQLENLWRLDLGNNEITGPLPPEILQLRNLRALSLWGNRLTGSIPSEIGQLENLVQLNLGRNKLSGPLPPEIGQLENLWRLYFSQNQLSGPLPSEIGQLENLGDLSFSQNQLSGPLPSEIGQLDNLTILNFSENQLTGPLPLEIGQLENLEELNFNENQLTGPLPPEIGQLENLRVLNFSENRLTGAIPSEFGELNKLEEMWLSSNLLTGNIPDAIGDLASLSVLDLTGNTGMSGALPVALTRLNLETFLIGGTSLCAPEVAEFQEWLQNSPNVRIMRCDSVDGKSVAYLVQATQSLDNPVPLIAGEGALLRVFIANESDIDVELPLVKATFYHSEAEVYAIEIPGNGSPIPRQITEGDLSSSANARIPGSVIMPGLEMVVEVDPDGELDPALGLTGRLPESGRMAVDVRSMPLFDLTLVPFLWTEDPDMSILTRLEELTPESDLFRFTRDILPVGEFDLNVREPVWTSLAPRGINRHELFRETIAIHAMDGASGHYMGILESGGLAQLGGKVTVSPFSNTIMAHELGHNLSLPHAPCGDPPGVDPYYPYPDGVIGAWGYDQDYDALVNPNTQDLMSYCFSPHWISDYNFTKAMNYRLHQEQAASLASSFAPSDKSLLLWGGINGYGELVLEPAFAVDAPVSPPLMNGPYRLTGEDTGGGALFSFSFGMAGIADGEGASFAFILPARAEWPGRLARIVLTGPEGIAMLGGRDDEDDEDDKDNTHAAILLDSVTGRVRGILRDWPGPADASASAARRVLPENGLEVSVSNGIPDAAQWSR